MISTFYNNTMQPIFGTISGFDSGGEDAMCWLTRYNLMDSNLAAFFGGDITADTDNDERIFTNKSFSVDSLNEALYSLEGTDNNNVQNELLPKCFDGSSFVVKTISEQQLAAKRERGRTSALSTTSSSAKTNDDGTSTEEQQRVYLVGNTFTAKFHVTIDSELLKSDLASQMTNGESTIDDLADFPVWFRLILCNAEEVAYCHPYILDADRASLSNLAESNVDDNDNDNSNETVVTGDFIDGDVLEGKLESDTASHGPNTYVYTNWVKRNLKLDTNSTESNLYHAVIDLSVRLPENSAGVYFVLGNGLLYMLPDDESFGYRIDFANTISSNIIIVQEPPRILSITRNFLISIGVLLGVFGLVMVAILYFVATNLKSRVMQLAQGDLLICFAACSLWTIVCSFLFLPIHDVFCRLSLPLVLIPATLMATILVGRLWRVYMTLSGASNIGSSLQRSSLHDNPEQSKSKLKRKRDKVLAAFMVSEQRLMEFLAWIAFSRPLNRLRGRSRNKGTNRRSSASLRQTASRNDTLRLAIILSFPQIVIQIVGAAYYDMKIWVELNEAQTIGREQCYCTGSKWLGLFGMIYLVACYGLAVLVAWYSRQLPTAFNEKDQIFQTATINGIVCVIILGLSVVTDTPTTHPNISAFLWIILFVAVGIIASWVIIMPKIRRLRSKEPIVVSSLLRQANDLSSSSEEYSTSSIQAPERRSHYSASTPSPGIQPAAGRHSTNSTTIDGMLLQKHNTAARPAKIPPILVNSEKAIPQSVESEIAQMKAMLDSVTEKCLHGRPLNENDWEKLREQSKALLTEVDRVEWCDDMESEMRDEEHRV
eukprot:CAMPEP_0119555080 /NCGR_PEP_ID=MMETSP1352-20130426/7400_1 /TAXON_ID=265584 /ORGANISM="Stauroneis constricta, Strain CCMP1120" /LENGTH=825 /DNA_ID=CAMNT_0007601789 /DNA_START=233 /DNA_END=2710 /DNA_ORIENTATION=-